MAFGGRLGTFLLGTITILMDTAGPKSLNTSMLAMHTLAWLARASASILLRRASSD